ncbi:MAG: SDR family oxidoreductase [Pseudomonadota bacterium]|jgi:NAD(P)-dependent dehydrogenase (short-subunit alcohol dehydrogenase family)
MTQPRIAVVTGANRGIGREIARQLAACGLTVVLTSRDPARGRAAAEALARDYPTLLYHPLDVTKQHSVDALRDWLQSHLGRADVLVNNAGVMLDGGGRRIADLSLDVLQATLEVNLYGALRVTQALLPMMRRHRYGRIVNLSSGLGQLADMGSGTPAYRISKTALNAFTRILAAELEGTNIKVNSLCPGWVRTDLGGPNAPRSVEEGADTAVWLATLPDKGPSGGFFRDRKRIAW